MLKVEHSLTSTPTSLAKMQRMYYFFLFLYTSVYKNIPVLLSFFVSLFVLVFILTGWFLDNFIGHRFKVISYQDRRLHFLCSCSGWKNSCVLQSVLRLAYLSRRLWGFCWFVWLVLSSGPCCLKTLCSVIGRTFQCENQFPSCGKVFIFLRFFILCLSACRVCFICSVVYLFFFSLLITLDLDAALCMQVTFLGVV